MKAMQENAFDTIYHFGNFSERLIWHFLTHAQKSIFFIGKTYPFEVVNL